MSIDCFPNLMHFKAFLRLIVSNQFMATLYYSLLVNQVLRFAGISCSGHFPLFVLNLVFCLLVKVCDDSSYLRKRNYDLL